MKSIQKILIAGLICMLYIPLASANTPNFGVLPGSTNSDVRLKYVTTPGGEVEDSIQLVNKSEETITLEVIALDAFDDDGNKMFAIDPTLFDAAVTPEAPKVTFTEENMHMHMDRSGSFIVSNADALQEYLGIWTEVEKTSVTLKPGETEEVEFEIDVPQEATEYTTYTGGILVRYIDPATSEESGSSISTGVAERIYLDVLPEEVIKTYLPEDMQKKDDSTSLIVGIIAVIVVVLGGWIMTQGKAGSKKKGKKKK